MSPPAGSSKEADVVNELNSFSLDEVGGFESAVQDKVPVATQYTSAGGLKERVRALLIAGATNAQVAGALGIDESYISQLRQNEQFSQEIIAERAKKRGLINDRYDEFELRLLDKLGELIDSPVAMKVHEVFKALQLVGTRKREAVLPMQEAAARSGTASVVVNLQLSPAVAQRFLFDQAKKNIIGISAGTGQDDAVAFAPMPSVALLAEAKEVKETKTVSATTLSPSIENPNNESIESKKDSNTG